MKNQLSTNPTEELAGVFQDVKSHILVSGIIRDQLTTNRDVREEALKGLDFTGFTKILDIGCGFGFFTRGLAGRLRRDAEVTGIDLHEKYRKYYLASAEKAGIKGKFISKGISVINDFSETTYDLIICSYALYFFPGYIQQISRILKDQGLLVVITHSCPHMKELTYLVKEIMASENISHDSLLPYEMLINRFCDYNGNDMLSACFRNVNRKEFRSEILFDRSDFSKFVEYFRFKTPFFIPSGKDDSKKLSDKIFNKVKSLLDLEGSFHITKDDTLYVCSKPLNINTK